jgi:DNA-binding transcriptional LysR family regulator
MIEVRLLRNAIALANHRSFARAALELNISQPTLSRNIQMLEQIVGAKLFDRLPRTTIATPVGEELLRHARNVIAANRVLEEGIQQFIGLETGRLSVGAGIAVAGGILGPSLVRFHASYPEVALHSLVADWRRLPTHLRQGDVDLFIGEISECREDDDLEVEAYPQHQVYFCCRAGHPLLARRNYRLVDALTWPLVVPEMPKRFEQRVYAAICADGVPPSAQPEIKTIVSNDWAVIRTMLARSDAIGLTTFGMLEEQLLREEFVLLPSWLSAFKTNYGVVARRGMSLSPVAKVFTEILSEEDHALVERERAFVAAAQTLNPIG